MEDIPKTVLRRMREAAPVEGHPDADLLTGFAEQSLAESERREVLQHLARCGNCREVLSLALPASESIVRPDSLVARRGWLSWPVLRWGVVAAGIILVTSVGVIQYQRRHQDQTVVAKSVPQLNDAFQGSLSSSQAASSQAASSPSVAAPDATAKKMELRKEAPANAQQASSMKRRSTPSSATQQPMSPSDAAGAISTYGSGGGIGSGSGNGIGISSPNESTKNPSPVPIEKSDLPGSSQMVEVQTETVQAAPAISDVIHERLAKDSKGRQAQARELTDSHAVGKAKNPVAAPATVPLQTSSALMRRASPRWTITPAGGLQRSFDAGQTWEDVNVVAESVGHRSEIGSEIGRTANQKAVTEYKDKKSNDENADKVLPSSNLIFRAVVAIGSEVWVGGSNTILYHSVDSGAGWIRVWPSQTGAVLSGDITSIDFSDLQHGRILTSTGEVWLTVNDGETWEKQ